jgi:hypothetical protein
VTPEALLQAELRYQEAHGRAEGARTARNELIFHALEQGWTHARIAQATGMTRSRIGQIAMTRRSEPA